MSSPPPEGSEDLKKALDEVEATAKEAQDKITEARKAVTDKIKECRLFHMTVRKKAMEEYGQLQTKLAEVQKKLMPFRTFKRDFQAKVKAKQALTELVDKLNTAELEVEKAAMMGIAAESGQMSEKVGEPALASVQAALKDIDNKFKGAQSAVKDELTLLKDRGVEMRKKSQKQGISAQQMAASIVLPAEESSKAIGDCEAAAAKADAALNQAKTLIRTKQADAKKFPKELQDRAAKELSALLTRAEACGKKITDFKKETMERKLNAIMAEAMEAIKKAEAKVNAHAEVAKVFSEDLNSVTEEAIKDAMEKVPELETDANATLQEAKKEVATKQKEAKGATAQTAMQKLQGRLKAASDELMKNKKASTFGEKLIKGKEALAEEMGNVDKAEAEVAKVEKLAEPVQAVENPTDEERMGIARSFPHCAELGDAIVSAQNSIKNTGKSVEKQMTVGVPPLKAAFSKVADRNKKRSLGEAYVREGKKKIAVVDSCVEKAFRARNFIAAKLVELRAFSDKEPNRLGFGGNASWAERPVENSLTARINTAGGKHSAFKKDTEARKKAAQLQEAGEKIAKAEAEVAKVTEITAPLDEEAAEVMGNEEAASICEKAGEQAKTAQELVDQSRTFLTARQRENQGNAASQDTVKSLQTRLAAASTALSKAKKTVSNREHKFVAKKLLHEVEEMIASLEPEVKAAEEACIPLLEKGGEEFLVAGSLRTLASALRAHGKEKSLDVTGLFNEAGGGKPISEADAASAATPTEVVGSESPTWRLSMGYMYPVNSASCPPFLAMSESKGKGWGKRRDDAGAEKIHQYRHSLESGYNAEQSEGDLVSVEMDALVFLQIMKHCRQHAPQPLLGMDVGSVLQLTHSFGYVQKGAETETTAQMDEGVQFQMDRTLRSTGEFFITAAQVALFWSDKTHS
eukprot:g12209.t1